MHKSPPAQAEAGVNARALPQARGVDARRVERHRPAGQPRSHPALGTPRRIQVVALALAGVITLATLGSLGLLAEDQHASTTLAGAAAAKQTVAALASVRR